MTSSNQPGVGTAQGITNFQDALTAAARKYVESSGFAFDHVETHGLTATLVGIEYTNRQETDEQPESVGTTDHTNDTDTMQQDTWTESYTNSLAATVTITQGLETGGSASFGLPDLGLGVELKVNATTSTADAQAESASQTVSWTQIVSVPPHSRVTGTAMLRRVRYNAGFTATYRIEGDENSCPATGTQGAHTRVFLASPGKWFAAVPTPGFTPEGSGVLFRVQGVMSGMEGRDVSSTLHEFPLKAAADAQPARSYTVQNVQAMPKIVEGGTQ